MKTIESLLAYLESQGHGVTARELSGLIEAERANPWPNLPAEDWSKHMPADAASVATPPPRVTAEDWDKIHAMLAEAQAVGENLDAVRSRFGLETPPPADPIAAIRARHDAVEQRRSWASTVVTSDGEQAHRDREELLEALADIAHEVGICHEPDGGSCVPGPFERVLEEVRLLVKHAGERFDMERERDDKQAVANSWYMRCRQSERERDEALTKLEELRYRLTTIADEELGIAEVMPVDDVVSRIERGMFDRRLELQGAQAKLEQARTAQAETLDALTEANAETIELMVLRDRLRAKAERCDRYEAPGPVLLTQEQIDAVANSDWEGSHLSLVHALLAAQHARDVAIVEAMNDESIAIAILTTINRESAGEAVRAAILRALKGET